MCVLGCSCHVPARTSLPQRLHACSAGLPAAPCLDRGSFAGKQALAGPHWAVLWQELFQEQWEAAQRDDEHRRPSTSGLLSKLRKNMKGPGGG